jgi:hypothetical protein
LSEKILLIVRDNPPASVISVKLHNPNPAGAHRPAKFIYRSLYHVFP